MKAIWHKGKKEYVCYEGYTETVTTNKGTIINGLENVLLFTNGEAALNTLPASQEWRTVQPRINWRML